jgi:mannose-6-phosphate isomerase
MSTHKVHKGHVPFLLKILSVRTALSIQAHPDKRLAQELHARRADLYKDDNHKPEMSIAITPFEALCSFQRATSIVANCAACPELVDLIGEDAVAALEQAAASDEDVKPALRELYTRLLTTPPHVVEAKLVNLMTRICATVEMLRAPVDTLAMRVHEQYPGDVGVFCVYLLNYICLKPGGCTRAPSWVCQRPPPSVRASAAMRRQRRTH